MLRVGERTKSFTRSTISGWLYPALAVLCLLVLGCGSVVADTIHLRDGTSMHGRIIAENDDSITLEVKGLDMVFSRTEILAVDRIGASMSSALLQLGKPERAAQSPHESFEQPALDGLLVRIGSGGVTVAEFTDYLNRFAGTLKKDVQNLTAQERHRVLTSSIEDELLFQGALAGGVLKEPAVKAIIIEEYQASPQKEKVDPNLFTEKELREYYASHTEEFSAADKILVESLQFSNDVPRDSVERMLVTARANPGSVPGWVYGGWITKGESFFPLSQAATLSLFKVAADGVSDIISDSYGNMFVFHVKEVKKSEPPPFEKIRARVIYALAKQCGDPNIAVSTETLARRDTQSDEEKLLRRALKAGALRWPNLRSRVINHYLETKSLKRQQILPQLRNRFPVEMLEQQQ